MPCFLYGVFEMQGSDVHLMATTCCALGINLKFELYMRHMCTEIVIKRHHFAMCASCYASFASNGKEITGQDVIYSRTKYVAKKA